MKEKINEKEIRGQNKPNIFIFGRISEPTSYVVDRIKIRVSLMLSDGFEFYSLDDGLFLHILWSNFRQKDRKKKLVTAADIVTTVSSTTMIEALHEFGKKRRKDDKYLQISS